MKTMHKSSHTVFPGAARLTLAALGCAFAGAVFAQSSAVVPEHLSKETTVATQDKIEILRLPKADARRVYVTDPDDFAVITHVYTIDGNTGKRLAITDAGKLPNVMIASDGRFFAIANSLWSRIARGKRDDYIEVYDAESHEPTADIDIPEARFLTGVFPWSAALSTDDKEILFHQFSPEPAVGLVDLQTNKFVKMMNMPDCYHIYPAPQRTFYMHCREGNMLKVTYDAAGNATTEPTKIFHKENEYLMNNAAYSPKAGRIVFSTYEGKIFQVDVSSGNAVFPEPFETFTAEERAQDWAPGGWMPVAYHRPSDRIFVLADQRKKWTHKTPSRFVFVHDAKTGKRLSKIELGHEVASIAVSQDAEPQLYALSTGEQTLHIFDVATGKKTASTGGLGFHPTIINVADW